jgi:hypothetical protein
VLLLLSFLVEDEEEEEEEIKADRVKAGSFVGCQRRY